MDRWLRLCAVFVVFPAIAFVGLGCGNRVEVEPEYPPGGGVVADLGGKPTPKNVIQAKSRGMITGQITFAGEIPPYSMMDALKNSDPVCKCASLPQDSEEFKRHTQNQQWLIDPETKGLSDVIVYVQPKASNTVFLVTDEEANFEVPKELAKKLDKKIVDAAKKEFAARKVTLLTQPHCVYEPHAFVLFPMYHKPDPEFGAVLSPTQQIFTVTSTAATKHNTQYKGAGATSGTVNPTRKEPVTLNSPDEVNIPPQSTPVTFGCNIHAWMDGKAIVLSHPYAARTDNKGRFVLPLVPAGEDLQLLVWHDGVGGFLNQGDFRGDKGKDIKLKANEIVELNLQISK
ncbi:MAG: hypothetical protein ACFCD0_06615 [Gemmataceae bacterium]